jgi:DNA-binding XRE family transcriptional regulator
MQVHVKTHRTKINIEGDVSKRLLKVLKDDFGGNIVIEDDELIDITKTEWYKKINAEMTPADYMKGYRMSRGYTQIKLGKMLGGLTRQYVSDIEKGRRSISKEVAKKLAEIFNTSVDKFL